MSGEGPPLVLVHGATADHHRWRPLLPYLERRFTVRALDRRGRGESGDAPTYDIVREFEDVAAVVDAVAEDTSSPVDVYGHSYGGMCAFGAATLTANVRRLVLYEGWPPVHLEAWASPLEVLERMDSLLGADDRDAALELLMREVVMMSDDEIAAIRAQPSWPARVAAVHTVPRELRALTSVPFDASTAATISAPTLLIVGSESPDPAASEVDVIAAALPNARIQVLDGHQHVADVLAPELVAEAIISFLEGPAPLRAT
jgi:pimeloyl-ACP methyl ester carboxylesterase